MDTQEPSADEAHVASRDDSSRTITIIGPLAGMSRDKRRDIVENTVDVAHVRRSFEAFLQSLKEIINVNIPAAGPFQLEEVEFSAEISANGELKLLGTGVGVEARSGVKFTLKRTPNLVPDRKR